MKTPESWIRALGTDPLLEASTLLAFLEKEEAEHTVYPPPHERLTALERTPFEEVSIVILGQDPYHGPGQAHGLSFSVKAPTRIPPSLRNIYRELASDLGIDPPDHGDLSAWADQGVLLLNTVLTVRHKSAGSHRKKGWEAYTDALIDVLAARERPIVFVLWGRTAQQKAARIPEHHLVLQAPHPSPLSARTGFFGSRPFSQVNTWMREQGREPIRWAL